MTKLLLKLSFLFLLITGVQAQDYQTPVWTSDVPTYGEISGIGISDPRIKNQTKAIAQAKIRAMAMITLFKECEIAYTSEHFQVETEEHLTHKLNEIVEKLGQIKARIEYHPADFEMIESKLNDNKEFIALMSYKNSGKQKDNVLSVFCEFYSKEYEVSNTSAYSVSEILEFLVIDSTKSGVHRYSYMLQFDGHDYQIETITDGDKYTPPGYFYTYNTTANSIDFSDCDASENLNKGLWQGFLRAYVHAVGEGAKNYSSKIKELDDSYSNTQESNDAFNQETSRQELSREVYKNHMQFWLNGFDIKDNVLYLNVSSPQLNDDPPRVFIECYEIEPVVVEACKRSFWDWLFGRNKCE